MAMHPHSARSSHPIRWLREGLAGIAILSLTSAGLIVVAGIIALVASLLWG